MSESCACPLVGMTEDVSSPLVRRQGVSYLHRRDTPDNPNLSST